MLDQRRRRWADVVKMLCKWFVLLVTSAINACEYLSSVNHINRVIIGMKICCWDIKAKWIKLLPWLRELLRRPTMCLY